MLGGPVNPLKNIEKVKFITLNQVISLHKKLSNLVLKMDVDGYEYEIFDSTDNLLLNQFRFIALEYHFGVQGIVLKLEAAGFKVSINPVNKVKIDYHPTNYKNMDIGLIYAERITILN